MFNDIAHSADHERISSCLTESTIAGVGNVAIERDSISVTHHHTHFSRGHLGCVLLVGLDFEEKRSSNGKERTKTKALREANYTSIPLLRWWTSYQTNFGSFGSI
jgi:hypothetical protein